MPKKVRIFTMAVIVAPRAVCRGRSSAEMSSIGPALPHVAKVWVTRVAENAKCGVRSIIRTLLSACTRRKCIVFWAILQSNP